MSNNHEVNFKDTGNGEKNLDLNNKDGYPEKDLENLDLRLDGGPGYPAPEYEGHDNAMNESVDPHQVVRPQMVPQARYDPTPTAVVAPRLIEGISPLPEKSYVTAYLMTIPFGFLGMQHFYLNRPAFGVIYFWTLGLFGVGWFIDWWRMPWLVMEANKNLKVGTQRPKPDTKNLVDAYILWFPLGILGFHHYYLRNYKMAVVYTFTLGFFGIGWLVDMFRMPCLVVDANKYIQQQHEIHGVRKFRLCDAYILGGSPLGLLGAHHYYLQRYGQGVFYTCTFGVFGIGWLVDLCRMWKLVDRANKTAAEKDFRLQIDQPLYLDDAYLYWMPPLGLIGLHHYYLGRYIWGAIYTFTLGLFGIGWLIDMCRLPCIVKNANIDVKQRRKAVMDEMGAVEAEQGAGQYPALSPALTSLPNSVVPQNPYIYTPQPNVPVMPLELGVHNTNGTKQCWELHMYNNDAYNNQPVTDPHGIMPTMPPSYDSVITEGGTRQ